MARCYFTLPRAPALVAIVVAAMGFHALIAAAAALWSPLTAPASAMMLNAIGPKGEESIVGITREKPAFRVVARLARSRLQPLEPGVDVLTCMETSMGRGVQVWLWSDFGGPMTHTLERAGWPFHAFECEGVHATAAMTTPALAVRTFRWSAPGASPAVPLIRIDWAGGVDCPPALRPRLGMYPEMPRAIPFRPVALGFVLNTIFFSVVLLMPRAVVAARSQLRHRRGLCPWCGYALAGLSANSPCPECGHTP